MDTLRGLSGGPKIDPRYGEMEAQASNPARLNRDIPAYQQYTERVERQISSLNETANVLRERLELILRQSVPSGSSPGRGAEVEPSPPSGICNVFFEIEMRTRSTENTLRDILDRLTI